MANLTFDQLYSLAVAAGVPSGDPAATAAAIAMAESAGNPAAVGDIDKPSKGCRSFGLWQINSCPARDRTGVRADTAALLTPEGNARAMAVISSNGRSWSAWTTYRTGDYRRYLAKPATLTGTPVILGPALGGSGGAAATGAAASATEQALRGLGLGPLLDLAGFFQLVANPHTWWRIALFLGGLVLVVIALVWMNRDAAARVAGTAAALA